MLALGTLGLQAVLAASLVVDAPHAQVYVGAPDATVTALALATGATAWTAPQAGEPLVATARGLVTWRAEAQKLRLALHATGDGKQLWQSPPVTLPEWLDGGAGQHVEVSGTLEGEHVRVRWHAQAEWAGGAAPTVEQRQRAHHEADGALLLRLRDGSTTPAPNPAPLPPSLAGETGVPILVGDRVEDHALVLGRHAILVRRDGDTLTLERHAMPSGTLLGKRPLGHGATVTLMLTGDELALVTREGETARASLFRVPAGTQLATVTVPPDARALQLAGDVIVYIEPARARLMAVDRAQGRERWSHPLPTVVRPPPRP